MQIINNCMSQLQRSWTQITLLNCLQDILGLLDNEQVRNILHAVLHDSPRSVAPHLLHNTGSAQARVQMTPVPTYCMCGQCIIMDKTKMNLCTNHINCITTKYTFHDLCQRASVLEIAGVMNYCDQFHDDPIIENRVIRNQAYRFFILRQFSKLGHGNKVSTLLCCSQDTVEIPCSGWSLHRIWEYEWAGCECRQWWR